MAVLAAMAAPVVTAVLVDSAPAQLLMASLVLVASVVPAAMAATALMALMVPTV
jgi:hypothetical protein